MSDSAQDGTPRSRPGRALPLIAAGFARDGAVRLTLITGGGPFDERTRHYRDNVVITARPAGGAAASMSY